MSDPIQCEKCGATSYASSTARLVCGKCADEFMETLEKIAQWFDSHHRYCCSITPDKCDCGFADMKNIIDNYNNKD